MSGIDLKFDGEKDVSQPVNLTFYPEGWNAAGVNLVFSEALDTSHPVKLKFGTGGTEEPEAVNASLVLAAVVPAPNSMPSAAKSPANRSAPRPPAHQSTCAG